MDQAKCRALKASLSSEPEPQLVAIERFFDGNDDLGSIGCNLDPHPGIGRFRKALCGLSARSDVEAVYAQISELDPGEGSWPFTDTILIVGRISAEVLHQLVGELQPDEIGTAADSLVPPTIAAKHSSPVALLWWD